MGIMICQVAPPSLYSESCRDCSFPSLIRNGLLDASLSEYEGILVVARCKDR